MTLMEYCAIVQHQLFKTASIKTRALHKDGPIARKQAGPPQIRQKAGIKSPLSVTPR